ncbi:hypothetical protein CRG98_019003 [Punica granatum]|uniref:Uncharacterized protein n=1 Tax=Punica granatum TaxID=22663 RepID=A0A2I0JW40_PUNGR|nr:hypothetical protein CRG98_019003 [Punica granatum]
MDLGSTGPAILGEEHGIGIQILIVYYPRRGTTLELPSNLQTFRDHVQLWNKEVFGHILGRKRWLLARLQGVQRAIHTRPHRHLRELEESLSKDLEDILAQEEKLWFQKSRTEWINSGDRNTKYFHTKAVAKRRRIRIEMLLDSDGRWITDTIDLAGLATRHLRTLFTDDRDVACPHLHSRFRPDLVADI